MILIIVKVLNDHGHGLMLSLTSEFSFVLLYMAIKSEMIFGEVDLGYACDLYITIKQ